MSSDLHVLFVDPGRQVPSYSRALTTALARQLPGGSVTYATAPLLHYAEGPLPGVEIEIEFSSRLAGRASLSPRRRRALKGLAYPFELRRFAKRNQKRKRKPSILHLQWSLLPVLERSAWRRIQSSGIPWIQTVHNVLPHESRPWQAPLLRRLYRSADQLIVHSQHSRERLIELLGPTHPPIEVLEMPADPVPVLGSEAADRQRARQRLGLVDWLEAGEQSRPGAQPSGASKTTTGQQTAQPVPLALFFGHVRPYKGLDLLLEAWPLVLRGLPRARLLIAGNVAGGPAAVDRLQQRLREIDPSGSIRLAAGYVPADRVSDHFAAADLVVAPYLDSDHSAVITAARGYGRAVLATAVGGLPEALARGGGRLVAPRSEAIAKGLIELLGDPERIAGHEREARAAAKAWTWDDAAEATVEIYRRVIAARGSA